MKKSRKLKSSSIKMKSKKEEKKYEFFEHTADAKFRAYGETLGEAFSNAALALYSIMTDVDKVEPNIEKSISVKSATRQALLYDFLDEFIYLTDTEGFLLSRVKSIVIKHEFGFHTLQAEILGDHSEEYDIHTQVKAITYNDMEIIQEGNFVMVQVVPDL